MQAAAPEPWLDHLRLGLRLYEHAASEPYFTFAAHFANRAAHLAARAAHLVACAAHFAARSAAHLAAAAAHFAATVAHFTLVTLEPRLTDSRLTSP